MQLDACMCLLAGPRLPALFMQRANHHHADHCQNGTLTGLVYLKGTGTCGLPCPQAREFHCCDGAALPTSQRPYALPACLTSEYHLFYPSSNMPPPEAAACAHACSRQQAAVSPAASSQQTPDSSGGTAPCRLERQKSARRRAAEAILHRRFSGTGLAALAEGNGGLPGGIDGIPAKRQRTEHAAVRVAACCTRSCHTASSATQAANEAWCMQDVSLPAMDWPAVLQAVKGEADVSVDAAAGVHTLPGGQRRNPLPGHMPRGCWHTGEQVCSQKE